MTIFLLDRKNSIGECDECGLIAFVEELIYGHDCEKK